MYIQVALFYCLKLSVGYLVTTCIYSPNKYLITLITCNRGFIFNVSLRLIYYFLDNVVIRILDGEVHHSTSASQNLQNTPEVFVLKKNDVTFEKKNYFRGRDLYKLEKYGEMFPIYGRKNIPNPLRLCYCDQNDSDNQYLSVAAES